MSSDDCMSPCVSMSAEWLFGLWWRSHHVALPCEVSGHRAAKHESCVSVIVRMSPRSPFDPRWRSQVVAFPCGFAIEQSRPPKHRTPYWFSTRPPSPADTKPSINGGANKVPSPSRLCRPKGPPESLLHRHSVLQRQPHACTHQ